MKKLFIVSLIVALLHIVSCSKKENQTLSKEKPKPSFGETVPTGHLKAEN